MISEQHRFKTDVAMCGTMLMQEIKGAENLYNQAVGLVCGDRTARAGEELMEVSPGTEGHNQTELRAFIVEKVADR